MEPGALGRRRRRGGAFSIAQLFANGEAGAWYDPSDLTTLFQDAAGTTPVTAVEQPVGLMLDKSKGALANLGPEMLTNPGPTFSATTGWTSGRAATLSIVSGTLRVTNTVGYGQAYQVLTTVVGTTYRVTVSVANAATLFDIFVGTTGPENNLIVQRSNNASGTYTVYFTATTTTSWLTFGNSSVSGGASFDILFATMKAVPGAHVTASGTARPTLRARYNLLTFSEQFNDASWTKTNATVTANATTAPDGTTTADALFETTTNGAHAATQTVTTLASRYTVSYRVKANGRTRVLIGGSSLFGGNLGAGIVFDLSTGQYVSGAASGAIATITSLGNDWYLVSYEWTALANTGILGVYLIDSGTNTSYAGDVTKGVYLWGADFRPTLDWTAFPQYQRIAAATDYDTTGFLSYLAASGAQAMSTPANVDLSSTNKVTVVAGVTKLSDAATGFIAELSASADGNNGTFYMVSNNATYTMQVRGNQTGYYVPTPYAAPRTDVLTMLGDIGAASLATEVIPRINGAVVQTGGVGTAGTGNFGSYPLFLFARSLGSFPLTGRLYALIVRGAATDATTVTQAETWVNTKTRAY